MTKDIIEELHGAADRAGLVCTKTGNFRAAMIDSAHLRKAAAEIEQLRAERDEARRRVCDDAIRNGRVYRRAGSYNVRCQTPQEVAEMMGWDCFKDGKA
jgi:hypothetical protein